MSSPSENVLIVEGRMVESPCIYIAKGAFTWRKQFRRQASSISPEADVESIVNIAA
jgi:hypothetical protein